MNYEMWQDLWERQPLPPPRTDQAKVLRELRADSDDRDRSSRDFERATFISLLFFSLLSLVQVWNHGFDLTDWLHVVMWGSWAMVAVVFRWRRRTVDRQFGESLLDRIDHARQLVRETVRFTEWLIAFTVPVGAIVIALMVTDVTDGRSVVIPLLAGGIVLLVPLCCLRAHRRHRNRLLERITELDTLQKKLVDEAVEKRAS